MRMKYMVTNRTVLWTCVCLLVTLMWASTASAAHVRLDADLGTPKVLAGEPQKVYLRVGMTGLELAPNKGRPPVNVAIVLDKSGSMSGDKIASARRAARIAVERLQPDDIVSVIVYDTTVTVICPATRASDKAAILNAISRGSAGGNTALFAGVSKGAQELRKFLDKEYVNRVVLLSDGLANVGPSSPGQLAQLGQSLGREGIAVTTIGLGLGYNEDLMTRLADTSDGNHLFAEEPSDLEIAFDREFGDVLSVVAQDVHITINCADGVRPLRTLGREMDITGQNAVAGLNQIYSDQMKYVMLELEVPPDKAETTRRVAEVELQYRDMGTGELVTEGKTVNVAYVANPELVEQNENAEVMVEAVSQIGNDRNEEALRLRDEGKVQEAQQVLHSNEQWLGQNAAKYESEQLQEEAQEQAEDAANLDEQDWDRQRKIMKEKQYMKTKQQKIEGR